MAGLARVVARQPAAVQRAEGKLVRRFLAGRSFEEIEHGGLTRRLVRFPIPDGFFELRFPSGRSAWFDAPSAPFLYWAGFQTFEPSVVPLFAERVAQATTFVDVGAAFGFYTLYARSLNPSIAITAIEANPQQADVLERTLQRNGLAVPVVRSALSDERGSVRMSVAGGHSSIEPGQWTGGDETIEVPSVTFDELVSEPPDLVKIDVEGAELRVLRGMSRTLSQRLTTVFCEVKPANQPAVTSLIADHGYAIRSLSQEDFLFQPA